MSLTYKKRRPPCTNPAMNLCCIPRISAVYGFFVGLVVMATLGVVLAPIAHRIMHKFHLDEAED